MNADQAPEIAISIVIPCYNHGVYIQEAIDSITKISTPYAYEIIIVNDGSNQVSTLATLDQLEADGYTVLHQTNKGLAAARNNGILAAKGLYILPLDSDNQIHHNYLNKAIDILEADDTIDVVYGNPEFFGNDLKIKQVGSFRITKILKSNYIDACAVIRKSIIDKAGGYDGNMPAIGNEDWELWIHLFFLKANMYYLNEVCFYYRTTNESMRLSITQTNFDKNKQYIYKKHAQYFADFFIKNHSLVKYIKTHKIKAAANLLLGRIK